MGKCPPEMRRGVTLDQAIDELFTIVRALDDAGIEHGGYGLLEQHQRVKMLEKRYRDHVDVMKRAIIRAHRAENALRQRGLAVPADQHIPSTGEEKT